MSPWHVSDREQILADVRHERWKQLERWGEQDHSPHMWLAILTEEVGEVAKEIGDTTSRPFDPAAYRAELVQVAAVAVAALESLDRSSA